MSRGEVETGFLQALVQFLFSPLSDSHVDGSVPILDRLGTGVTSDHDKEAHQDSDSVFYERRIMIHSTTGVYDRPTGQTTRTQPYTVFHLQNGNAKWCIGATINMVDKFFENYNAGMAMTLPSVTFPGGGVGGEEGGV